MNTRHILPGYSFNLKKNSFRKRIYHKFKNGFPVIERDYPPLEPDELEAVPSKIQIDPVLIYGILKKPKLPTCVPKCIKYHGITLSFKGCIVPSNVSNLVEEIINRDIDNIRHECTDMLQESIDEEKENEFIHKNTNNENNQIQKNHTNNNGILALASKELISSITGKLSNANNETKKLVHGTKNLKDDNTQPLCSEDLKGTHDHEKNSLNERKDLFGNNKDLPDNCSTQTALVKGTMDSRYDSQANKNESNEPCFTEKESYGEDIFRSETNMIKKSDTVRGAHDKKEREVILTYYLEDDSIEIKEKILDTSQYGKQVFLIVGIFFFYKKKLASVVLRLLVEK